MSEANQNERMVKPLVWTEETPSEPGTYINRLPGIVALVRVPKDLSCGIVIVGNDFYHRSPLAQWSGEWYGPIPW